MKTIAFPAISTGVYGYPLEQATEIALKVGAEFVDSFDEIRFVTFSANDYEVYQRVYERLKR